MPHHEPCLKLASYGGFCLMDNLGLYLAGTYPGSLSFQE
jgi:hypothetical protein